MSDKSITIKTGSGQTQTAEIDSKTTTQKLDGTKLAPKDIKKDTNVVVSGSKQDNGSQLALRIPVAN